MQNPPARRHWWSKSDDPDLPPISTARAYAEVLFAYLCFFAVGIILAGLLLAGHDNDVRNSGSWGTWIPGAVNVLAEIGLAVAVVLLLASRRGVSPAALGVRVPRGPDGRFAAGLSVRVMGWTFLAIILGDIPNALLQSGNLPKPTPNAPELIFSFFNAAQAGIIEELVVLAFVIVTLRQARRPWWEVVTVALVLRAAYHIYYGPGVLGIVLWASIMIWIYLRFRQVVPMMVTHAIYDGTLFFAERWGWLVGLGILFVLGIWIASGTTWLVERSDRNAIPLPPPAGPIAGWYPDPGGLNCWRWWDGRQWTPHISSHPTGVSDKITGSARAAPGDGAPAAGPQ